MSDDLLVSRAMSFIVHGESKAGKSTLANTAPGPRLLLDVEMAYRFLEGRKKKWDPHAEAPPVDDGTWDTAVVVVRSYHDARRAFEWLASGQHPFKSVILDSISELQTKARENLESSGDMTQQLWGKMLFEMDKLCRNLRDLTEHPTKPLEAVVITALTHMKNGKFRPYMQGQIQTKLPYFFDVIGFLAVDRVEAAVSDVETVAEIRRKMLIGPHELIEAGSRVNQVLGDVIINPNIEAILDQVFGTNTKQEKVD